ncbi:MAG TPA: N-formylglutamate deformylase [Methylophilus sp.]
MTDLFSVWRGNAPLLISMPHSGTLIPADIAADMTVAALQMPDVDWHLPHLYDMATQTGATVLSAHPMRYVIDLNRPKDDASLYPGQDTTGLCPIDTFSKQPIYKPQRQPNTAEIQRRIQQYWQPYHHQISMELQRLHAMHGIAVLLEAHSIASQVPRFFSGKLPDLNFGTADTHSCARGLQVALESTMQDYTRLSQEKPAQYKSFSYVFNGRFKGGYITRHYGMPAKHIHAIQLEISQCTYMHEAPPYDYQPALADTLKPLLSTIMATCITWAQQTTSTNRST